MRSEEDESDAVDALRDAHRTASEHVGDRPDPAVRAAVLAAAARAAGARPQVATASTSIERAAASRSRRWSWSAAALLVVSMTAGLFATRMLRERPAADTTLASSTSVPQPATAQGAPVDDDPKLPPSRATALAANEAPAPVAAPIRPKVGLREPPDDDREHAVDRAVAAGPPSRVASPERRPFEPRIASPAATTGVPGGSAAVPAAVSPLPEATPLAARPAAGPASPPMATPESHAIAPSADAAGTQATAPSLEGMTPKDASTAGRAEAEGDRRTLAQNAARSRIGRAPEPATPEAWIERIVTLRAEGHDVVADRELDALRRRYPDVGIPARALRSAGTR